MKKNVLIKGILLLILLALLTMGFTGCGTIIIPTTGTVVIIIAGTYSYYDYYVHLDSWSNYVGRTYGGSLTVTGVTPGWHTFYVDDVVYEYYWEDGTVWVTAGQTSYLTLYPY